MCALNSINYIYMTINYFLCLFETITSSFDFKKYQNNMFIYFNRE